MKFVRLDSFTDKKSKQIYRAYTRTFPEEERRDHARFLGLYRQPEVFIFGILEDIYFVGYIILWKLKDFVFVEHFEIFSTLRGKNYGSRVMQALQKKYDKITLEIEPPYLGSIAAKRLRFYEKNGFKVLSECYTQPSYIKEKPSVELYLLSNTNFKNPEVIIKEIHSTVYRF
ncbi:MAG: GNAT family N-acetyltransferase [Bergeyella sp.]|nr:GNAT family N-acetyltransferase [Bergeyella sp.]